jgi:hypothetical protein
MTEQKKIATPGTSAEPPPEPRRRRHGYRGYPMRGGAEGVHWGKGFSGVEPPGAGSGILPRAGMLTESSHRDAKR